MDGLNRVTTLSKIIAAVLFVMLPILAFWAGYQYGDQYRATLDKISMGSSSNNESTIPTPGVSCTFNNVDGGYGVSDVTEIEKKVICNANQTEDTSNEAKIELQIAGKEGRYIWYGNETLSLAYVQDTTLTTVIGSSNGEVLCNEVDGLGVTHILPNCVDQSGSVEVTRATK